MSKHIIKHALIDAGGTTVYIIAIASFLFYAQKIFGANEPDTVLAPIVMLLLFVISAATTSSLVFGKPILWYLEGKKKEAVSLLAYTLGLLLVITLLIISII